ncbi:uncharacterized protein LOC108154299 [Drosophila miranda]|uniref:uncharacterized protein LOC108154299 n=1 Tax=Drosophila miranda TaxID=7229 RepID=UPI0007E63B1E|nr:uncharacterized protein LOC108154299 [Drosophila miranda]
MSPLLIHLVALLALACVGQAFPYSYHMRAPSLLPQLSMSSGLEGGAAAAAGAPLANRIVVQSPSLDNVYMDYLVTSKPLNLRKYNKNGSKTKKTKKDSKIYYIPVPPLPFRHIPGIGLDYQPMKINPIILEKETPLTQTEVPQQSTTVRPLAPKPEPKPGKPSMNPNNLGYLYPSKLLRVQHHKDYYFNGRPHRLQVAHADAKSALTALNLKSKFYYNKNIIY